MAAMRAMRRSFDVPAIPEGAPDYRRRRAWSSGAMTGRSIPPHPPVVARRGARMRHALE
jgi:hypothetical protein